MSKDDALRLAQEAMNLARAAHGQILLSDPPQEAWKAWGVSAALTKAMTAASEALAEQPKQQQEPVAWYCKEGLNRGVSLKQECPDWEPLYTTKFNFKPLTDEEADELVRRFARYELLRAIEAKLKERNA